MGPSRSCACSCLTLCPRLSMSRHICMPTSTCCVTARAAVLTNSLGHLAACSVGTPSPSSSDHSSCSHRRPHKACDGPSCCSTAPHSCQG